MNSIHSSKGLPGLKKIREKADLSQSQLSDRVGCTAKWVYLIENGTDCTQELQRKLAEVLHCTPADLLSEPSEQRLKEIRAAYLRAQADQAEADLAPGKAVGL